MEETRDLIGQQDATCIQAATVSCPAEGGRRQKQEKDAHLGGRATVAVHRHVFRHARTLEAHLGDTVARSCTVTCRMGHLATLSLPTCTGERMSCYTRTSVISSTALVYLFDSSTCNLSVTNQAGNASAATHLFASGDARSLHELVVAALGRLAVLRAQL